ncbi:Craniofacial development protein 2 [Varanus komodoensis]|nr:Craniofacial development protein 2 [Varanus komodoensis]
MVLQNEALYKVKGNMLFPCHMPMALPSPNLAGTSGRLLVYSHLAHFFENKTESLCKKKYDHQVYYCGQESLRRNGVAFIVNKRVGKAVLGYNLQNDRMISVRIQGKPFNITIVQVYAPTTGAEEAEADWYYESLQHLLELTPKNDVLIIMGDWNAKVGSQKIMGITGKFGLGVQNEAGHRLVEFCQENMMVIANTLFQQPKRQLYTAQETTLFVS